MNRLINVHNRFKTKFKRIDGMMFYGQLLDIPDTSRVSNFLSARRYLRTGLDTVIKPRDVIVCGNSTYIVAEHGEGFYTEPIYRHFKLFEVDETVVWNAAQYVNDPVTNQRISSTDADPITAYLSMQPHPHKVDSLQIPAVMKFAVVDKDVQLSDKIGDYIVTKSDHILGVTTIEMKKA